MLNILILETTFNSKNNGLVRKVSRPLFAEIHVYKVWRFLTQKVSIFILSRFSRRFKQFGEEKFFFSKLGQKSPKFWILSTFWRKVTILCEKLKYFEKISQIQNLTTKKLNFTKKVEK